SPELSECPLCPRFREGPRRPGAGRLTAATTIFEALGADVGVPPSGGTEPATRRAPRVSPTKPPLRSLVDLGLGALVLLVQLRRALLGVRGEGARHAVHRPHRGPAVANQERLHEPRHLLLRLRVHLRQRLLRHLLGLRLHGLHGGRRTSGRSGAKVVRARIARA
ncbi:unnamed protein product, partial [Prorocentrum cordatum]